jgi:hypothetical protein
MHSLARKVQQVEHNSRKKTCAAAREGLERLALLNILQRVNIRQLTNSARASRERIVNKRIVGFRADPDVAEMLDQALGDHPILSRIINGVLRDGLIRSGYKASKRTTAAKVAA